MFELDRIHIAIVGLGYVGLPLAVEPGRHFPTTGFDIDRTRFAELHQGRDCIVGDRPERIDPGNRAHRLPDSVEVTPGSKPKAAASLDRVVDAAAKVPPAPAPGACTATPPACVCR